VISSPHIIGEILDRVYPDGSFTSPPLTDVQTTVVPPGGATVLELTPHVPGTFRLVDHALIRVTRGLVGALDVTGPPNPEIFHAGPAH
jgi:nitrite reductase (NO-forming)